VIRVTLTVPAFPADPDRLFRLIKAGFGEKRKQLKNSIAGGLNLDSEFAAKMLKSARLAPTARAQELDLKAWDRLYQVALKREVI
jgi:16S rRNA (adenine1518-N6/adenine1519-N6)-dimethyltransferase